MRARQRDPDDLLADVRQRLASGEPLEFLVHASMLLAAVDPRGQNPFERERSGGPDRATLPTLVESFAEVVLPETTALLAALAELGPDELTRARAARALASRSHPLPDWLARLGEASVYRATESTHVLGDGDNVLLGARLPDHELTAVIYIDHNLGTVVKDAFPVPGPISAVIERLREAADDPDVTVRDIGLGDARARVAEAIEVGAITFPPFGTETGRPRGRSPNGCCGCCLRTGPGTSGRNGARPRRTGSRTGSSAPSSASRWTTLITAACWMSSCGSAPTTGPVTRCGGARSRWRSCWPTGSHARSWRPPDT